MCTQSRTPWWVVLAVSLMMLATISVPAQTWSGYANFNAGANPAGAWSYGWADTPGGTFHAFSVVVQNCGAALTGWAEPSLSTISISKQVTPGPISCASWHMDGPYLITHPAPGGQYSVLRWTAPFAASFNLTTTAIGCDYAYPTTTDVHLVANGSDIYSVNVFSYNIPYHYGATVFLNAGETVELATGFGNGNFAGDTTGIELSISAGCFWSASSLGLGVGCGGSPLPPALASGTPRLGTTPQIAITGAPPAATGEILLSAPNPNPIDVGFGCQVWLDLPSMLVLLPFATDQNGDWSIVVGLPPDPGLAGITLALQAWVGPAAGPLGIALTNGVMITLGC